MRSWFTLRRCTIGFIPFLFFCFLLLQSCDITIYFRVRSDTETFELKSWKITSERSAVISQSIPYSVVFEEMPDSYDSLFSKTLVALRYAFRKHPHFQWYLKADDDTFFIIENLRQYLRFFNSTKPYFLGFRMKKYLKNGYNSGGAGYVISREAMRLFNSWLYEDRMRCPPNRYEDVGIARCFESIGVYPFDTRNAAKKQRFNGYGLSNNGALAGHDFDTPCLERRYAGVLRINLQTYEFQSEQSDFLGRYEKSGNFR